MRGAPRRVDANHHEIVQAFRQLGCPVVDISAVGDGVPDIIVRHPTIRDMAFLVEIKTPKGKLNKRQMQWHAEWGELIRIIRSVDEAIQMVRDMSGGHGDVG